MCDDLLAISKSFNFAVSVQHNKKALEIHIVSALACAENVTFLRLNGNVYSLSPIQDFVVPIVSQRVLVAPRMQGKEENEFNACSAKCSRNVT